MASKAAIEDQFWKALRADMVVMLGCEGAEDGQAQPMTALFDPQAENRGPIYFFTTKDNGLVEAIRAGRRGTAHFASKGHDLFACVHGDLNLDDDRLTIRRLWNPFAEAWFDKGQNDPNLQLVRFDADTAEVWLNDNSLFAGIRLLLGRDPKKDYRGKTAEVSLR